MKYLKLFENFEDRFGKLSPLERQFSDVVVSGLNDRDDKIGDFWAAFTALKIELKDYLDTQDPLYKEMMYRIVDDQDPVDVMTDIIDRLGEKTEEMDRLLKKLSNINPYKYREETYDDGEEGFFKETLSIFNDRKDELIKLTDDCLVYLKDEHMNFKIRRLNIKKDKRTGFEIKIKKYHPTDEDNGIYFNWDDIKDDFITFCEMLTEKSFEIYDSFFFDDVVTDYNNKCLTFTYDEIMNDRIGNLTLYDVRLFVK